tara:strand:- start:1064 stop:1180 length:117 start_codon:yes stop_codon:yes gene_type:complete
MASVTQKIAIINEPAATFIARGFMSPGEPKVINTKKEP